MDGSGALNGYRLRSAHGDTIDPRQPLPVVTAKAQEVLPKSDTIIYNGKAAQGAITVNALKASPVLSIEGDQIASYWGQIQNKVYNALADNDPAKDVHWIQTFVETDGSADITIFDPAQDLEEMFESLTTTVKRFVMKVTDSSGKELYGWIMGVADGGNNDYTFDIFNDRLGEGSQDWVGTEASFDETAVVKAEIFRYNSPIVFGTGTTLTEEVDCTKEYSKSWEKVMEYAETLSDGQYFVDYLRGRIVGVKDDNTASEVVAYNVGAPFNTDAVGAGGMTSFRKVVTAAGTPERAAASSTPFKKLVMQCEFDNNGYIARGDSSIDLTAGSQQGEINTANNYFETLYNGDLYDIYIDSSVSGEGVTGWYTT